jgi:hypothetical protein
MHAASPRRGVAQSLAARRIPTVFTKLPIGRSAEVRWLALSIAAGCVASLFYILHLRATSDFAALAPIFVVLFIFFDYSHALVAPLLLIAACLLPARDALQRLVIWMGSNPASVAIIVCLACCAGSFWVYFNHPLSMDEYAPYFQAEVFASGRLAGQFPLVIMDWLVPRNFQNAFLVINGDTGEVASGYWPGFALLLTPFSWAGIAWALNPVLSGLSVLALHKLVHRLFADTFCSGLAILLMVASPVFLIDGVSYYTMTAHMLCNSVFALLLLDATPRRLLLAGLTGSVALTLHNPVPHLLFALPWGIWLLTRPRGVRQTLWLVAGYLPLCLLLGVGWYWYTTVGMHSGPNDAAALASGKFGQTGSSFGMPDASVFQARLVGLIKIWLWAVPGLLVFAAAGAWRHRGNTAVLLLGVSALLTLLGYCFVMFDQGHGWGYRYFHSAWFVLPVLAAAWFAPSPSIAGPSLDVRSFAVALALLSLVVGTGQRALQVRSFVGQHLAQLPAYAGKEPRLVFVDVRDAFYGLDLIQNQPFLRRAEVRLLASDPDTNARIAAALAPTYRLVYSDKHGEVWSAAPAKPQPTSLP